MTDAYTLRTNYGFDDVEIESIKILFNWHFNYDESHHVLLSEYYEIKRADWVAELLVFIKAEMLRLNLVDRREVATEDSAIHVLALSQHFETIKWVLENDVEFNQKLSESLQYLKSVHPTVYDALKKNVCVAWGEYERHSSFYNMFRSIFQCSTILIR